MDFFTADLHLGHANILKFCRRTAYMTTGDRAAFEELLAKGHDPHEMDWKPSRESVDLMDEGLISTMNDAVGKDDTLWIVGDFARPGNESRERYQAYRAAIRCDDVRLLWGNHDNRHKLEGLFTHTYEAAMLYIDPAGKDKTLTHAELYASKGGRKLLSESGWRKRIRRVFLSHYCHVVWHHSHKGVYHLYGHTHGNLESWRKEHMPSAPALDIGVDCWGYKPLSFAQVDQILAKKVASSPPHAVDQPGGGRTRGGESDD